MSLGKDKVLNPKTLRLLKTDGRTLKDVLQGCQSIPKKNIQKFLEKEKQLLPDAIVDPITGKIQ